MRTWASMAGIGLCMLLLSCTREPGGPPVPANVGDLKGPEQVHRYIAAVLQSNLSEADKVERLKPYVKVGDRREDLERRLGPAVIADGHAPGTFEMSCFGKACDYLIRAEFYPDGVCYGFSYWIRPTHKGEPVQWHNLATSPKVTWPRTKEQEEYLANGGSARPQSAQVGKGDR